ncbi:MAG: alpha/beta hydrolase [Chlamydiia bacterium]
MKKFVKAFLTGICLLFVGNCIYLYNVQDSLIFAYKRLPKNHQFEMSAPFEERTYAVDQGINLSALYFPSQSKEEVKGVVLCFHGRGTNIGRDWGKTSTYFTSLGYDFIVYDYRGFGKSDGSISTKNICSDPMKMVEIISSEYRDKKLIVYGCSLGTFFATYVSSIKKPDAMILEAPFYSMLDMACLTKPYIPRFLLQKILKYPLKTNCYIKKVDCPILIFHGTEDETVPFCESVRLFDIIKHKTSNQFIKIESANHSNLSNSPLYAESIENFVSEL